MYYNIKDKFMHLEEYRIINKYGKIKYKNTTLRKINGKLLGIKDMMYLF